MNNPSGWTNTVNDSVFSGGITIGHKAFASLGATSGAISENIAGGGPFDWVLWQQEIALIPSLLNFTHSMTGGVTVAGDATIFPPPPYLHEMTGGVAVGGEATIETDVAFVHAMTGGITVGGDATVTSGQATVYNLTDDGQPTGGMKMGGTAIIGEDIPHIPSGGMKMGGAAIVREVIPLTGSGGMKMGGTAAVTLVGVVRGAGGMKLGGAATVKAEFSVVGAGGMKMGGAATVREYSAFFQPSGGMKMGGAATVIFLHAGESVTPENPYNDPFPGWAINFETNAPSRYSRLPATSIFTHRGVVYVTNAAGIYRYGADDDAGEPIRAGIFLPETDYGSESNKNVPDLFVSLRTDGQMRAVVSTKNGEQHYYPVLDASDDLRTRRAKLGLGLRGRHWKIGLENVDGAHFEIESMTCSPKILKRHGR